MERLPHKIEQPVSKVCTASVAAVGDALYVINGKWKLKIMMALIESSKRFNELQRTVSGISAKVLSNELKELELNGLVKKNTSTHFPAAVDYELTAYSRTLKDVLQALSEWGMMHRNKITGRDNTHLDPPYNN